MKDKYISLLNFQIKHLFLSLLKINILKPGKQLYYLKALNWQKQAIKKRIHKSNQTLLIPAILILSITNRCNLKCRGCYIHAQKRDPKAELDKNRIEELFNEAENLGISIIFIVGGEPLLRNDILVLASSHRKIIFPVLSNGTLLNSFHIDLFIKNPNLIPVLSIEGQESTTEKRRGEGIYKVILNKAHILKNNKIFFGFSITLARHNSDNVLNYSFIEKILLTGCKLIYFVEYVPADDHDLENCMTKNQKELLKIIVNEFRKKYNALFISLPGDEEQYGGCMAAGRGFVHISANGDVEPCPFAPYSNSNINDITLQDALKSGFLNKIRKNHDILTESIGGCALWENKKWVEEQLNTTV